MREQDLWPEHADFMDALAAEGFIVLGGPLDGGPYVLHIIDAESEERIHERLDEDPWTRNGLLRTTKIEEWEILLRAGET